MTEFHYQRLTSWATGTANGWATTDVAARFAAGTNGAHYLEVLPFGPEITAHPFATELIILLENTRLEHGVLMDFGCGNGVVAELIAAAGLGHRWHYIGIDVNPHNIESCRRRFPGSRFAVVAAGEPLPFADKSVDIVLASGVLEYLEHPVTLLTEFQKITKAWVMLCRIGMRTDRPSAIYRQSVQHAWGKEEHCMHVFSRTELEKTIATAGLAIAHCELSIASGEWTAPDDPEPLKYYSYLLQKSKV